MPWKISPPPLSLSDPLSSPALPQELTSALVEQPFQAALPGGTAAIEALAKATIELFNDLKDSDASGVVAGGSGDEKPPFDLSRPTPLFEPNAQACWLKYAASVQLKADPGLPLPGGLVASGAASLLHAHYVQHVPSESVTAAVRKDVAGLLKSALVHGDVLGLAEGEAVALQAQLTLGTELKVPLSDLWKEALPGLSVPAGALVTLELKPSVTVTCKVAVTDEFKLVFARKPGTPHLSAAVRKSHGRSGSAGVGVAVEASLDVPVLTALLKGVAEASEFAQIDELVSKLEAHQKVSDKALELAAKLLKKLGHPVPLPKTEDVVGAWKKLKGVLEQGARQTVTASFTYEYARIAEDATLMELAFEAGLSEGDHQRLLSGRWIDLGNFESAPRLIRYLHQTTTGFTHTWGFGLKWRDVEVKSEEKASLQVVKQYSSPNKVTGPRRFAYLGNRTYEDSAPGPDKFWAMDFRADMPGFKTAPTLGDFQCGLFAQQRPKDLGASGLRTALDAAVAWRVLGAHDLEPMAKEILAFAKGRLVGLRTEVKFGAGQGSVWADLLGAIEGEKEERLDYARALARVLPQDKSLPGFRASCLQRENTYAPVWSDYLGDRGDGWTFDRVGQYVTYALEKAKAAQRNDPLWMFERHGRPGSVRDVLLKDSAAPSLESGRPYGQIFDDWCDTLNALHRLREEQASPIGSLETNPVTAVFQAFDRAARSGFRYAALVSWLMDVAKRAELLPRVGKSVTAFVGDGDDLEELILLKP